MIVKIGNRGKGYNFFDADSIMQSRTRQPAEDLFKACNSETLFLLNGEKVPENGYLCVNLYKNQKIVQWVVTDRRCYIMNNEGRTIDKIN